jgi:uncharacterized membrane protein
LRTLLPFAAILEILAITIWTGGLAALGFIAAPAIFQTAPSRDSAGRTFGLILKRFHWVAYACGVVILLAGVVRWMGSYRMQAAEVVRYIIALLMLCLTLYSGLVLLRKVEKLRAALADGAKKDDPRRAEFNGLHRRATTLMAFNVLLGFALAAMFALQD